VILTERKNCDEKAYLRLSLVYNAFSIHAFLLSLSTRIRYLSRYDLVVTCYSKVTVVSARVNKNSMAALLGMYNIYDLILKMKRNFVYPCSLQNA